MWLTVKPYFRQCAPPEFSAMLPPMVHTLCDDGWRARARRSLPLLQAFVGGDGEEVGKVVGEGELVDDGDRLADAPAVAQLGELLLAELLVERARDRAPVVELGAVLDPLPQLRA